MNGGRRAREGWNGTGNERLSPVSLPVTSSVWSWVLWAFPLDAHTPPHTCQDTHTLTHTHTLQAVYFIHWLGDKHTQYMCFCLSVPFLTLSPSTFHILHHTPDAQKGRRSVRATDTQTPTQKRKFVFITDCISLFAGKVWDCVMK